MASTTADPAVAVSAPPLHSPQNWLFRTLPLRLVIPVVLVAIAVTLIAVSFDAPAPYAVGGGALVVLISLIRVRGSSLAGFLDEELVFRWHAFRDRSTVVSRAPFDVPLPDGGSYGMRWDGARLITMLRIDAPPRFVTLLSPSGLSTGEKVPLPEIARCLNQFDIDLDSIDVISTGSRTSDAGAVARLYDQILGPLPAVAQRSVWVVLRLNPLANAAAVDRRGGGSTGTLRSAIIATRRVANRLAARGLTASVLSSSEMNTVVHQLTSGAALDEFKETSQGVEHDGIYSTTYRMALEELGPRGFADVWATQSLATTMTLRLRRAADTSSTPSAAPGRAKIAVTATVRFDTRHAPAEVTAPGLVPMPGKQYRALLHSLPLAAEGPELPIDSSLGTPDSLAGLSMPIAGCGQLIGADTSGQGVALPLVGQHVRRVEIIGALLVAKQVILRAIALGATVVVHTNRHEAWRAMVAYVDSARALSLAAWSAGSQQANSYRAATVIVYDGIQPSNHHSDATVMLLRQRPMAEDYFNPDVTLTEDAQTPNLVTVRTAAGTTTVYMVATPFEMTYLGEPHPLPA